MVPDQAQNRCCDLDMKLLAQVIAQGRDLRREIFDACEARLSGVGAIAWRAGGEGVVGGLRGQRRIVSEIAEIGPCAGAFRGCADRTVKIALAKRGAVIGGIGRCRLGGFVAVAALAFVPFDQRVLLDFPLDESQQIEVGELQQLYRLLQLRGDNERLCLPEL
jgi:hypothetical protein